MSHDFKTVQLCKITKEFISRLVWSELSDSAGHLSKSTKLLFKSNDFLQRSKTPRLQGAPLTADEHCENVSQTLCRQLPLRKLVMRSLLQPQPNYHRVAPTEGGEGAHPPPRSSLKKLGGASLLPLAASTSNLN